MLLLVELLNIFIFLIDLVQMKVSSANLVNLLNNIVLNRVVVEVHFGQSFVYF